MGLGEHFQLDVPVRQSEARVEGISWPFLVVDQHVHLAIGRYDLQPEPLVNFRDALGDRRSLNGLVRQKAIYLVGLVDCLEPQRPAALMIRRMQPDRGDAAFQLRLEAQTEVAGEPALGLDFADLRGDESTLLDLPRIFAAFPAIQVFAGEERDPAWLGFRLDLAEQHEDVAWLLDDIQPRRSRLLNIGRSG